MTAHPIDTEALRGEIEAAVTDYQRVFPPPLNLAPNLALAVRALSALAAAEHRATRAEAQAAIRGRAVVIYRERAREAEAERGWDRMLASKYPEVSDLASGWQERAERAEARIKACKCPKCGGDQVE